MFRPLAAALLLLAPLQAASPLIDPATVRHWIDDLNRSDPDDINGAIPDAQVWPWLQANAPLFVSSNPDIDETYYYRWWAYRKHIETTPAGFVITEFLRPVKHATDYNAISCAAGLHIAEGRWLRDPRYLDDYVRFWLHGGPNGALQPHFHQFSGWMAAAAYDRFLADADAPRLTALFDALVADYEAWERERLTPGGLFWQRDVSDGMEVSISGGRNVKNLRPTINSYMYANARAISAIAGMLGKSEAASAYADRAVRLRQLTENVLWNPQAKFFETVQESGAFAPVRELPGYTPWYFELPEPGKGYEEAWKQLMDPEGFFAPYGPTSAEQRDPGFQIANNGDDCQWNGPSWPFSTSIALRALANLLADYPNQDAATRDDYFQTFLIYTKSQRLKLDDGRTVPFVDEDLNPFTGVWWARARKLAKHTYYGRGDHYNHSSYADLVVTGLAGLRPRADDTLEVNPAIPPGALDWFCLDQVPYHGRLVSILWDRTGAHFHRGAGLHIYVDGRESAHSPTLTKLTTKL
jgi:hypothetical protein